MNPTNRHLKSKVDEVNNFLKFHNSPPEDLFEELLLELEVSRLYLPGSFGAEEFGFEHLESEEGLMLLPLYTSPDEYSGESDLESFEFGLFSEIINEFGFEGCVINPNSDELFIPGEYTEGLRAEEMPEIDLDEAYDAEELKDIALTVKNEELAKFIRDDSNFNRFDDLIELLADSVLLSVVSSSEDLSQKAQNGIIPTLEAGGFNLTVKSEGESRYGLLFTDIDAIKSTCDTDAGIYYYCQVTSYASILAVLLANDLDGVIINPQIDDYYVPRHVLLDIFRNHPEIMRNPKYMGAPYQSFVF